MSTVRFRPTFAIPTELSPQELKVRIGEVVASNSDKIVGQVKSHHAMISIVDRDRHFWSPILNLEFRQSDSANEMLGRFSPHPSIWTGFMFAYLSLSVLIFFSVILGLSQQLMGHSAWGYLLLLPWIAIAAVLWLVSQTGQKLSSEEMQMLKELVEDGIHETDRV